MAIVFSILGKILFVLLLIICILLVLMGIFLFSPVHYKVSVEKGEEVFVRGMVRWLFFIVYCPFSYQKEGVRFSIRLFGIKIISSDQKKKKGKNRQNASKPKGKETSDGEQEAVVEIKADTDRETQMPEQKEIPLSQDISEETEKSGGSQESSERKRRSGKERRKREKRAKKERKKREKREKKERKKREKREKKERKKTKKNVFDTIGEIKEKIEEKTAWAGDAKEFWKKDETQEMVCILKDNVLHLIRKLKPKGLKGYVEFGTGDPASTGQALGALACVYAYCGSKDIQVVPDFEEKKLLGHLYVSGRFSLITLVVILLRVIFNKRWNRFVKGIKELKEAL